MMSVLICESAGVGAGGSSLGDGVGRRRRHRGLPRRVSARRPSRGRSRRVACSARGARGSRAGRALLAHDRRAGVSRRLPKAIACGRARLLAGRRDLAVRESASPASLAAWRAVSMRCTQNVHFSITPWPRTVTSGFSIEVHRLRPALDLIVEVVEAADLVRAVVRAVARADAAVVDHPVEAFVVVVGRDHRADRLARRRAAVLAQHRRVAHVDLAELLALDGIGRRSESVPHVGRRRRPSARCAATSSGARLSTCCSPTIGMLFST